MLIEFSVSNFRSFREKQTFSMVAAPRLKKRENVFKPNVEGEKLPDLLKVAAIYGPNASGKSNLIKALNVVSEVAKRQPSAQNVPFPVAPFRFDPELINKPSWFELHFIHEKQRYQFELALVQNRIIYEQLLSFPHGKETLLYERTYYHTGDLYNFGSKLEGGRDLHELWKKTTGPQVLFLNQAVANSSEELIQLRHPLTWLRTGLLIISENTSELATKSLLRVDNQSDAKEISVFLHEFDVPVTNIHFTELITVNGLLEGANPIRKAKLTHRTNLGEAEFDLREESDGTQNLIGFWLPWKILCQHDKRYRTLIVDELDSSLHPEIVASLIEKHLKAEQSSQLVFTTHDTHLMGTKLLRRDQFWITERDENGATQLRSIHDFEGRESEDIEKRYYEGRYRGLPFIRRG